MIECFNCHDKNLIEDFETSPSGCKVCPNCGYEGTDNQDEWNDLFGDE